MNSLYAAWLRREARETFGRELCELTDIERLSLEFPDGLGCVECTAPEDRTGPNGMCPRCGVHYALLQTLGTGPLVKGRRHLHLVTE